MLTGLVDLQRAALKPWVMLGRECAHTIDHSGFTQALLDHALVNLAAGEVREGDLAARVARDLGAPLRIRLVGERPFFRLFSMSRRDERAKRRLLLISPYSGYATRVISPLVAALLPEHEVWVTEWIDARLIPPSAGHFDLEAQILEVASLLTQAGPGVHVIGLSQSTVSVLAAVALLAAHEPKAQPASLTLLGGPLVPGARGLHDRLLPEWNVWLDIQAFRRVAPPWPGAGREVYPCLHQLLLVVLTHPDVYAGLQMQAAIERALGRSRSYARWLDDLHAVIDTPAELVRQMIHQVFRTAGLAERTMSVAGDAVDIRAIDRTPLLTIEAGMDALVGRGDTHRAADLLGGDHRRHQRMTLPGTSHPDLFTGPSAASSVAPLIRAFVERRDQAAR